MSQDWTFLIGVIVIFFVVSVIPNIMQRRRHEQEIASVHRGDWVITAGGIIGQIVEIDAQNARLRISPTGEMTILRQAIRGRLAAQPPFQVEQTRPTEEAGAEDERA